MPDVRYVCLSDLHFGAENSILTRLDPDTLRVDHTKPSPALEGLLACLRSVTERNEGSRKPTLILAGDIFELALARDNDAAMVFEMFVQQALGPDGIFDSNVYFIPGNHDHHLWEGVREKQYSDYVRARPPTEQLEPPWHVTRMRETATQRQVSSDLVTSLLDRALGQRSGVNVRVVYPNLALDTPSSNRHVFIHHGQFLEAMYTIMSTARDMVFPNQLPPPWTETPVWAWEAENFAWIDFFWSTLGRSGAVGRDVGVIYASLQSLDALRPLNRNLARGLAGRARPKILQRMYARVLAWVFDARRTPTRARPCHLRVRAHAQAVRGRSTIRRIRESRLRLQHRRMGRRLHRAAAAARGRSRSLRRRPELGILALLQPVKRSVVVLRWRRALRGPKPVRGEARRAGAT